MKSVLLIGLIHSTLVAFLGPVFKLNPCSFNNNIYEKQQCATELLSDMLMPFGTLSYCWAFITNMIYFYYTDNSFFILLSSFITLISLSCYAFFLTTQENVHCFSLGYYFVFIAIGLDIIFMVSYKLKWKRLL